MRNLRKDGVEIRRLIGDVVIQHEDITMKCDSAYEYSGSNRFDAFGNIVIIQEDSRLYGDTLYYDGNTKTGKVRGKIVKLVENDATLTTRFLDFDTQANTANFYKGGIIVSDSATFSSSKGIYYSNRKLFIFSGDVRYLNPDILLNTDSLEFYSETDIINFYGPTRIYNEENYLYCQQGWYDRKNEVAEFLRNTFIDNGSQRLFGDRVFHNGRDKFSQVTSNACLIDTTRNLILYGGLINFFEKSEYFEAKENPLAISISEEGDSLYLRANILTGNSVKDTIHSDSTYHLLKAMGNVKFYRTDMQGICDSMVYHSRDSILHMHIDPILWNEDNQITANYINIFFKNEVVHQMNFMGNAFVCSQEDSLKFNQIKGREIVGFFSNGNLRRLDVNGNGETVYFIRDQDVITTVNRAESSRLSIHILNNQVTSILFRENPIANLFPLDKAAPEDVMIRGFQWHNDKRPLSKFDIIPKNLDLSFHIPAQERANFDRDKKNYPVESL